nr:efflux RND transporter permease subunit [Marinobacter sp. DS40M8]
MNLSQLAFRFRPVVLLATVAAMFFGAFSYLSLPTREDPSITVREAVVSTRFAGLPAEQVEEWITKPLETRIRQVAEVEHIRSTSMRGQSLIHVEIQDRYFDLAQIWDDVRQKVESARSQLPEGTEAPVVNDDFGNVAVVTAALTSDQFSQAEQLQIAEHVRARLYGVEGTRKVELHGVQPERIYIDVSESRLANLGLTPVQLASQLSDRNVISPAGVMESGEQRLALQVSGAFPDLEALRASDIRLPDGGSLRLADLGAVNRGYLDPPANTAYHNGKRAIVFAISMTDGYSVLDYGEAVRARLDNIGASLPAGYNLDIMTFQADQVANAVYGVSSV